MATIEIKFKDLREAVAALNETDLIAEKIKLVGSPKEAILQQFMDVMAKIPDNAEGKFPGPKVSLDFYNLILDAEEKATTEKTEEVETKPDSEIPSTEAPVQKENNKTAKPPKEKKEKVVKEEKEKKISCTTRIMMIVVDNSGISNGDIKAILEKEGYVVSDNTLAMQKNDTLKTLKYIASKK